MNDRIARSVVTAATIAVAVMVGVAIYLIASEYKAPMSADPAFAPTIVDVPESFRRTLVLLRKDGSQTEHDGSELYRESFLSGWQDCADSFVADWKSGEVSYWSYEPEGDSDLGAPWIIGAPDEVNDARRDGWRMCRKEIQDFMKTRSESQVRALLAE